MDATLDWKVSSKVDGLVDALANLKQELTNVCFKMHGAAKVVSCNAYASEKVIELLSLSKMWKPIEKEEDDSPTDSKGRHFNIPEIAVADMAFFKLYKANVMGDNQIRLVAVFEAGRPAEQKLYGTIWLI